MKDIFKYERRGAAVEIVAGGSMFDVVADIGLMIHKIYSGIKTQSDEAAEVFKQAMQSSLTDDSPTWQVSKLTEGETMIAIGQKE